MLDITPEWTQTFCIMATILLSAYYIHTEIRKISEK